MASKPNAGGSGLGAPRAGTGSSHEPSVLIETWIRSRHSLHLTHRGLEISGFPISPAATILMDKRRSDPSDSDWSGCSAICMEVAANSYWRGVEADMHQTRRRRPWASSLRLLYYLSAPVCGR